MNDNELAGLMAQEIDGNTNSNTDSTDENNEAVETNGNDSQDQNTQTDQNDDSATDDDENTDESTEESTDESETQESDVNTAAPSVDWTQFLPKIETPTPDEDGNYDLAQVIQNQVNEQLRLQVSEQRGWAEAQKLLPEIGTNETLRNFIHNQRIADIANGGQGDIIAAAKTVKEIVGGARAEGKAQNQTSVRVQKAAGIVKNGSAQVQSKPKADLMSRLADGDSNAATDILAAWIDEGKI